MSTPTPRTSFFFVLYKVLANYGTWPNPAYTCLVNKVLSAHSHTHSFTYCLWLLSRHHGRVVITETLWLAKPKVCTSWISAEQVCQLLFWMTAVQPLFSEQGSSVNSGVMMMVMILKVCSFSKYLLPIRHVLRPGDKTVNKARSLPSRAFYLEIVECVFV